MTGPWYPDGDKVATRDANGRDLGYAGPDGRTLYYRGFPVGTVAEWNAIRAVQDLRYVSHVPDSEDSDPHVWDTVMREVVEALMTQAESDGRADELNADPSTDPRLGVEGFVYEPSR